MFAQHVCLCTEVRRGRGSAGTRVTDDCELSVMLGLGIEPGPPGRADNEFNC